jgi:hypothetical protein
MLTAYTCLGSVRAGGREGGPVASRSMSGRVLCAKTSPRRDGRSVASVRGSQLLFGAYRIVALVGLLNRVLDAGNEVLGQLLGNVALLVNAAALNQSPRAKDLTNRAAERFCTADNEQRTLLRLHSALAQVAQQLAAADRAFGCSFADS